jgi:biopolymer transport protein ExbD
MAIQFERRNRPKSVVDMIPMIDIVFQLVIFFMVATTFKVTTGIELEMPQSTLVNTIPTMPMKITAIDRQTIYIGDIKTTLDGLERVVREEMIVDDTVKQSVIIYGSKTMEYQLLVDIMDILRINGFDAVDLALKKKVD